MEEATVCVHGGWSDGIYIPVPVLLLLEQQQQKKLYSLARDDRLRWYACAGAHIGSYSFTFAHNFVRFHAHNDAI